MYEIAHVKRKTVFNFNQDIKDKMDKLIKKDYEKKAKVMTWGLLKENIITNSKT
jgi:hypothetical protein